MYFQFVAHAALLRIFYAARCALVDSGLSNMNPTNQMPRRRWRLLFCIVATPVLLFAVSLITFYEPKYFTCLHCRADKHIDGVIGFEKTTVNDTEFSAWYREHYPMHEHVWIWSGGSSGRSLFGNITHWSCGRRHPIHEISPEKELWLAKHKPDEFAEFYKNITSPDKAAQENAARMANQLTERDQ